MTTDRTTVYRPLPHDPLHRMGVYARPQARPRFWIKPEFFVILGAALLAWAPIIAVILYVWRHR